MASLSRTFSYRHLELIPVIVLCGLDLDFRRGSLPPLESGVMAAARVLPPAGRSWGVLGGLSEEARREVPKASCRELLFLLLVAATARG